jgi:hypothetical protein
VLDVRWLDPSPGRAASGINDVAIAKHHVVGNQSAASRQDPMHRGMESGTVLDVHCYALQEHRVEGSGVQAPRSSLRDSIPQSGDKELVAHDLNKLPP